MIDCVTQWFGLVIGREKAFHLFMAWVSNNRLHFFITYTSTLHFLYQLLFYVCFKRKMTLMTLIDLQMLSMSLDDKIR